MKKPFIFEAEAKEVKGNSINTDGSILIQKRNVEDVFQSEVGAWKDGIGIFTDNEDLCAYHLYEGQKYRITIQEISEEKSTE